MFAAAQNRFDRYIELKKRVDDEAITEEHIRYFDNDGFEISCLEKEFYTKNNVNVLPILNHACDQKEWITGGDSRFIVDHSTILQRWSFVDDARKQLESKVNTFPQLNKYLKLQPKWGIDFALEYYCDSVVLEVLHIEMDYQNYYEAVASKAYFEKKILDTDWENFTKSLLDKKYKWEGLVGMEQNDWKAAHWGLKKAERTYKAFL